MCFQNKLHQVSSNSNDWETISGKKHEKIVRKKKSTGEKHTGKKVRRKKNWKKIREASFGACIPKDIRVITKLPNSEQSYKGKVKTHKYINRQNQSTTGKL